MVISLLGQAVEPHESQLRHGVNERGQFIHTHQPAANPGVSPSHNLQTGGVGEPERVGNPLGGAQQRTGSQQSAAQSRVRFFHRLSPSESRPRTRLRLQRRLLANLDLLHEQRRGHRSRDREIHQVPGLVQQLSTYINKSNFGYFDASWTPVRRLTARLGANLTGTSGSALISITPNAPSGPLNSTYYQPFGGIDYHIAKGWTGRAYWGYYGYHEDQDNVVQDLFAPRNFRANLVTLSLRYAF